MVRMMKATRSFFLGAALLALVAQAQAGGEGWVTDMNAAKQQAAKEGKDLLVDFTGSDWCGWCKKLVAEVFSQDAFKAGVKDSFVLVELDFPRDKTKITEEALAANKELAEKYSVQGYPTIMLCDAQGRPYAKTGYQAGGPEAYVKHLNELRDTRVARDKAFADAASAQGVAKAKALVAALAAIEIDDAMVNTFYGEIAGQIKAADPADETGYAKKLAQSAKLEEFKGKLNDLARAKDHEGALKLCDEALAAGDFTGETAQNIMVTRAMVLLNKGSFDEAVTQIDKAIESMPESKANENLKGLREKVLKVKDQVSQMKKAAEEKRKQQEAEAAKEPQQAPPAPQPEKDPGEPIRIRDKQ